MFRISKKILRVAAIKLDGAGYFMSIAFTLFAIISMTLTTIILLAFTETQLNTSLDRPSSLKPITDATLYLFGVDAQGVGPQQFSSILNSATGALAVLVTFWFSVTTTVKYFSQVTELKRRALVRRIPVLEDEKDDLLVMLKFYKKAEHVTVYSGDFSWIEKNNELKNEITRLATEQKLALISHKPESIVNQAIQDKALLRKLKPHFKYGSQVNKKCSLVRSGSHDIFLYKDDNELWDGQKSVCIIFGKGDGDYLVKCISSLSSQS